MIESGIKVFGNPSKIVNRYQNSVNSDGNPKQEKEKIGANIALNRIIPTNSRYYTPEHVIPGTLLRADFMCSSNNQPYVIIECKHFERKIEKIRSNTASDVYLESLDAIGQALNYANLMPTKLDKVMLVALITDFRKFENNQYLLNNYMKTPSKLSEDELSSGLFPRSNADAMMSKYGIYVLNFIAEFDDEKYVIDTKTECYSLPQIFRCELDKHQNHIIRAKNADVIHTASLDPTKVRNMRDLSTPFTSSKKALMVDIAKSTVLPGFTKNDDYYFAKCTNNKTFCYVESETIIHTNKTERIIISTNSALIDGQNSIDAVNNIRLGVEEAFNIGDEKDAYTQENVKRCESIMSVVLRDKNISKHLSNEADKRGFVDYINDLKIKIDVIPVSSNEEAYNLCRSKNNSFQVSEIDRLQLEHNEDISTLDYRMREAANISLYFAKNFNFASSEGTNEKKIMFGDLVATSAAMKSIEKVDMTAEGYEEQLFTIADSTMSHAEKDKKKYKALFEKSIVNVDSKRTLGDDEQEELKNLERKIESMKKEMKEIAKNKQGIEKMLDPDKPNEHLVGSIQTMNSTLDRYEIELEELMYQHRSFFSSETVVTNFQELMFAAKVFSQSRQVVEDRWDSINKDELPLSKQDKLVHFTVVSVLHNLWSDDETREHLLGLDKMSYEDVIALVPSDEYIYSVLTTLIYNLIAVSASLQTSLTYIRNTHNKNTVDSQFTSHVTGKQYSQAQLRALIMSRNAIENP